MRHTLMAAVAGFLLVGCYTGVDPIDGETYVRSVKPNSIFYNAKFFNAKFFNANFFNNKFFNAKFFNFPYFNTKYFNMKYFNSKYFNNKYFNNKYFNNKFFNGTRIDGVTLDGVAVDVIDLDGSTLVATQTIDGEEVERSGEDVTGLIISLTLQAVSEEGEEGEVPMDIRIDAVYPDPNVVTGDVMLYDISMGVKGSGEWASPCTDAANVPQPIIFLRNYWNEETGERIDDSDVFTFACTTGVLAHCTQWGYRPWAEASVCKDEKKGKKGKKNCDTITLEDHHQACTRMARADYCGDGTPWTVAGTPIDIWDGLSPQINARAEEWTIEAEWDVDGAYCLSDIRQQGWKAEGQYPNCGQSFNKRNAKIKNCGTLADNRALLVSSFDPEWQSL